MGRHFMAKLSIFALGALAFLGCAAESGGENTDPSAPDNGKASTVTPSEPIGDNNSTGADETEQNTDTGGETEQNTDTGGETEQNTDTGGETEQNTDTGGETEQNTDAGEETEQNTDAGVETEQNTDAGGETEQNPDAGGGNSAGGDETEQSSEREKIGDPAVAVAIESLPNLHRVSADLYRSAQPAEGGLLAAQELGMRSVLSLSVLNADAAMPEAQSADLRLQHYPLVPWAIEQSQIVEMMQIFESLPKPALVHCYHGADRTGLFVAVYRILYQNWPKDEAKDELINGGYGYHETFSAIPAAIDALDVASLRTAVFGEM